MKIDDEVTVWLVRMRKFLGQAERENRQGWSIRADLDQMKHALENLENLESKRPKAHDD